MKTSSYFITFFLKPQIYSIIPSNFMLYLSIFLKNNLKLLYQYIINIQEYPIAKKP